MKDFKSDYLYVRELNVEDSIMEMKEYNRDPYQHLMGLIHSVDGEIKRLYDEKMNVASAYYKEGGIDRNDPEYSFDKLTYHAKKYIKRYDYLEKIAPELDDKMKEILLKAGQFFTE